MREVITEQNNDIFLLQGQWGNNAFDCYCC